MFFTLFLATIVLFLLYIKIKYLTVRGPIPGSSPHFLFGNLVDFRQFSRRISLPERLTLFKQRFGDIFQFWLGPTHVIVVGNINDVQHIFNNRNIYDQGDMFVRQTSVLLPDALICLKGATFKRHAAVTIPLFRRGKIVSNFDLVIDCTDKLLNNWRQKPSQKIHTDIVAQNQHLLLALFGYIGFDYDLKTLDDDDESESNNELTQELQYKISIFQAVSFAPRFLSKIYTSLSPRYKRSQVILNKYMNQMIEKELNESAESRAERKRTCLIASLVASLQQDEKAEAMKHEDEKKGLSRNEVRNEVLLFLMAGYESTSTVLSWFVYLMSKHPEVQQKIKEELMKDNENRQLTLERLDSLIYLDCVLKEVLRFCPPIVGTVRTLTVDDVLPESGYHIRKGDTVLIPFHNLAHDTRYWSIDPKLFCPERFLDEDKNHHAYAFIPFGSGHRSCIGQELARFELKVIAARFMQYVTFGDGGPDVNTGEHIAELTVRPKQVGVTISFDS